MKRFISIMLICILLSASAGFRANNTKLSIKYDNSVSLPTVAPASGTTSNSISDILNSVNLSRDTDDATIGVVEEQFESATSVGLLEPVEVEGIVNLAFADAYFADEVLPQNTDGAYSYIEGNEGYRYLVIESQIENLKDEEIDLSTTNVYDSFPFVAIINYGDEYYLARLVASIEDDSALTPEVAPGGSGTLYIFTAIPEESCDPSLPASAILGFSDFENIIYADNFGSPTIDWGACHNLYRVDVELSDANESSPVDIEE